MNEDQIILTLEKANEQYRLHGDSNLSDEEYDYFKTERSIADKKTQQIWYVLREMIVEDGLR